MIHANGDARTISARRRWLLVVVTGLAMLLWLFLILPNRQIGTSFPPTKRPNTRLQRTPLRVERDRAFFKARFCYNVLAIYWWRRR